MITLGIDIGGTAVKVAARTESRTHTAISDEYQRPERDQLRDAISIAIGGLPTDVVGQASAVGLCVPGRLAPDGGAIELAVNVPGLIGYAFDELIRDALGRAVPWFRLGDAESATLDVADRIDARRVLGIALGTGVGIALIEDGCSVSIGSRGAGHFGQIDVGPIGDGHTPASVVGPDGGRDSLEAYLGAPALRARLGDDLASGVSALHERDPALIALSRAIRIALAIYTPDAVVLLGGVGLALRQHQSTIDAMVRDGLTSVAPSDWTLAFGSSRFHAALGSATHARRAFTDTVSRAH